MARTPNGAFSFITNAGAARVKGVEFDLTAVPIENLQITRERLRFSRAALTENQVNANVLGPGVKGDEIPYVPRFTGGISAQYTLPMTSFFSGMARIDESYVGQSFSEFNNSNHFDTELPAYSLTNVRIGVRGRHETIGAPIYTSTTYSTRTRSSIPGLGDLAGPEPRESAPAAHLSV